MRSERRARARLAAVITPTSARADRSTTPHLLETMPRAKTRRAPATAPPREPPGPASPHPRKPDQRPAMRRGSPAASVAWSPITRTTPDVASNLDSTSSSCTSAVLTSRLSTIHRRPPTSTRVYVTSPPPSPWAARAGGNHAKRMMTHHPAAPETGLHPLACGKGWKRAVGPEGTAATHLHPESG